MDLGVIGNHNILKTPRWLLNQSNLLYSRHGRRKPCMLIPILGELITAIGLMLCTYFENTPMEVAGVTEALFPGLTGKYSLYFMRCKRYSRFTIL